MSEKRNGRPSMADQIEIEKTLWPYFESGYKAQRVADETGINVKTVRRYFRIWREKYIFVQGPEFFKKCRLSNGRTILELNEVISKLEKRSDELDVEIESLGSIQDKRWMYSEYRKTQESLSKLYLQRNNLENTATADVTLDAKVDELRKKMEVNHVAA
jgi:predicted transcriptional regulator